MYLILGLPLGGCLSVNTRQLSQLKIVAMFPWISLDRVSSVSKHVIFASFLKELLNTKMNVRGNRCLVVIVTRSVEVCSTTPGDKHAKWTAGYIMWPEAIFALVVYSSQWNVFLHITGFFWGKILMQIGLYENCVIPTHWYSNYHYFSKRLRPK